MAEDMHKIRQAEQRLLDAMTHAAKALEDIESGNQEAAQGTCSNFLAAVEESQTLLLQAADKHEFARPYALDATAERLEAAASERESGIVAAEAQQQGDDGMAEK